MSQFFFFSSRRRHTRLQGDWSSDVCSSDLLLEIRPTVMAGVPRLFEKVNARILDTVRAAPKIRRAIFALALAVGKRQAHAMLAGRQAALPVQWLHPLTDHLVFAKVRARLGGGQPFFISGRGAPVPGVARFFYAPGLRPLGGDRPAATPPVVSVTTPREA